MPFHWAKSTTGKDCFHPEAPANLVPWPRSWQVQQSAESLNFHPQLASQEESKFYRKEAACVRQNTSTLQLPCTSVQLYRDHCAPLPLCFSHVFTYVYLFLDRGEGREKGNETNSNVREKHQCVVTSHTPPTRHLAATRACALTGNPTGHLLVCGMMLNPLSHTSQGCSSHLKLRGNQST